jgi:hypothetical protein
LPEFHPGPVVDRHPRLANNVQRGVKVDGAGLDDTLEVALILFVLLIAVEEDQLDDVVEFSDEAVVHSTDDHWRRKTL